MSGLAHDEGIIKSGVDNVADDRNQPFMYESERFIMTIAMLTNDDSPTEPHAANVEALIETVKRVLLE